MSDAAGTSSGGADGSTAGDRDAGSLGPNSDAATAIPVDAVVMVHAAAFPPFRVCFQYAAGQQPTPSAETMPSSNLAGVEVGAAVRLPPLRGPLGRALVFEEQRIRALYPPGRKGPTCEQLQNGATPYKGTEVANLTDDLSTGVHVLALTGCRELASDLSASAERCGADWNALRGNLALRVVSLKAYARPSPGVLPVEALLLSSALRGASSGRAMGLAFVDVVLDGGASLDGSVRPFADKLQDFVPTEPHPVDYMPGDSAGFASRGFALTFGATPDGGGAEAGTEVAFSQSLAEVQRLSDPDAVPDSWYAVGASYVVMVLGDPDPRQPDGGTDPDPRRAPHMLAIPLSAPDAGGEAGP